MLRSIHYYSAIQRLHSSRTGYKPLHSDLDDALIDQNCRMCPSQAADCPRQGPHCWLDFLCLGSSYWTVPLPAFFVSRWELQALLDQNCADLKTSPAMALNLPRKGSQREPYAKRATEQPLKTWYDCGWKGQLAEGGRILPAHCQ